MTMVMIRLTGATIFIISRSGFSVDLCAIDFRVQGMRKWLFGFGVWSLLLMQAMAATYYVDAAQGNDQHEGTSETKAWKSLGKINATVFQAGDRILLRAGSKWQGMLRPQGSGLIEGNRLEPIVIDRYGEGPLPMIEAQGKHPQALLLHNVEGWQAKNLQLTNQGESRAPWRYGVKISADKPGAMRGIHLDGLQVRDVNGDLRKSHEGCGIFFEAQGQAWFENLLIENCRLERCDRNGICQRGYGRKRSTGVVIRGNKLHDIGGDGIKLWGTNGGLIERNVVSFARARCKDHAAGIWPFASDDTVIQFNQVSDTQGTLDGQAFDSDYECERTIIQYNMSWRNKGGFLLVCAPGKNYCRNTVVRYNLSVDDGVNSARVIHFGGNSENTLIHNNTFVITGKQQIPLVKCTDWERGIPRNVDFINNLIITQEGGQARYEFGPAKEFRMRKNVFVGKQIGLPDGAGEILPSMPLRWQHVDFTTAKWYQQFGPEKRQELPLGEVVAKPGDRDLFGAKLPQGRALPVGAIMPP
jgi:nitrous oxidase accessory protein NosD